MFKRFFNSTSAAQISLLFMGLMFLLPFIIMHHEQPIPPFYPEWIAAALGLMTILPLISKASRNDIQSDLRIPQVSLIFAGLTIILVVQWALGMLHSNQYALLILSYFTWAFSLSVLGSYLRRELGWEKLVTTLAWCLVVAGIINIGIVVLQFVIKTGGVIAFLPNLPSYGALSQQNHFADFCALATASLIYLHAKERFSNSFFYLILILFMFLLSFSGSRSVWLYLTALTILLVFLHRNAIKNGNDLNITNSSWRAGMMLLPMFIFVQLFIYFVIPNEYVDLPTERLLDGATALSPSIRLQFWYDSIRIFLQSPWLGVGAGKLITNTFLLVDTPTAMASKRVFEHSHNIFFHLLAEMGIGAILIVLAGLFAWVRTFKWQKLSLETCWLISLLIIISIHSMLEYPLWFTFFLGIAAILLGAGDEKIFTIKVSKFTSQLTYSALVLVIIIGTLNLATILIANIKLESWLNKLVYENINEQEKLEWVSKYSLLSPYGELMYAMSMNIDKDNLDKQIQLNQSVMDFRPFRTIAYNQALLLRLQGDNINAKIQLNRALIAYPAKFNSALEKTPLVYKQEFLNLLSEARPGLKNKK